MSLEQIYKDYPPTDDIRSGCKVGWRYYKTRKLAEQCAKAAEWNSRIMERHGYDFGYCCPGSIREVEPKRFEVCIP